MSKTSPVSADENPFRPDGDLSQEADAIVEAIKLGQPLSPTSTSVSYEEQITRTHVSNDTAAAPPQQANNVNEKVGNDVADAKTKNNVANVTHSQPKVEDGQTVEVQAALVAPASDGNVQVEHVTIEKKKKCCNGCTIL